MRFLPCKTSNTEDIQVYQEQRNLMIFYCIICLYRPFERKSKENEVLLKHLQYFPEIAEQVSRHVLKELCSVAQLDKCPEEDYTG